MDGFKLCIICCLGLHSKCERFARMDAANMGLEVVLEVGAVRAIRTVEGSGISMGVQVAPQFPPTQE